MKVSFNYYYQFFKRYLNGLLQLRITQTSSPPSSTSAPFNCPPKLPRTSGYPLGAGTTERTRLDLRKVRQKQKRVSEQRRGQADADRDEREEDEKGRSLVLRQHVHDRCGQERRWEGHQTGILQVLQTALINTLYLSSCYCLYNLLHK